MLRRISRGELAHLEESGRALIEIQSPLQTNNNDCQELMH